MRPISEDIMTQSTLDYLKNRVINATYAMNGEVITSVTLTMDNGLAITGTSIRDINGFQQEEAQIAAYENAMARLLPGVDFVLTKNI